MLSEFRQQRGYLSGRLRFRLGVNYETQRKNTTSRVTCSLCCAYRDWRDAGVCRRAASKIVTPNGDGTYTLSLSVTGKSQASQEQSKADVIVVLDTSTSMSEGTGNGTRIQVARQAVNSLAQELLANNTDENPDAVTLSLVTFDNYATTKITGTTAYTTFSNAVPSSVQYNRGTNWEDALKVANAIQTRDGADVYVIFVSDGNPTFRDTHGGSYGQTSGEFTKHTSGTGLNQKTYYGSGNSDNNGLNLQYAKNQASAIAGEGHTLFSVGVFGNVSNMQSIAQVAGQSNNYYSASDSAALNAAFANIINTITHNLAYSSVKVTDGLTSLAASVLVSGTADGFTYTQTKNGVTSDWNDAPAATFAGSAVSWDLSSRLPSCRTAAPQPVCPRTSSTTRALVPMASRPTPPRAWHIRRRAPRRPRCCRMVRWRTMTAPGPTMASPIPMRTGCTPVPSPILASPLSTSPTPCP